MSARGLIRRSEVTRRMELMCALMIGAGYAAFADRMLEATRGILESIPDDQATPTLAAALAVPEVAALHLWAKDAQQALLDAMEEIIELRLTLGKSDLEPPWLSDAIDQSRATLRALDAISSADPVTKSS